MNTIIVHISHWAIWISAMNLYLMIFKIRECRREKAEQLGVLQDIADAMGDMSLTSRATSELQATIDELTQIADDEDVELTKEEDQILALKEQIANFVCDCTYEEWGEWSECTQTCGDNGTMTRTREVKWEPKNGGVECNDEDSTETSP